MKKFSFLLIAVFLLASCSENSLIESVKVESSTKDNLYVETENSFESTVDSSDNLGVNKNFDYKKEFVYTGNDKYIKELTDEMTKEANAIFDPEYKKTIEIPTPYIAKIDDSDKNDIKIYGDFYIYGYRLENMVFVTENGGSFPGCYHFKEEDGNIVFVSKEIAEDGSKFEESLKRICGNDTKLYDAVRLAAQNSDKNDIRKQYVNMYAKNYGLKICGIKDFGWPVIIFNDIDDEDFVYLFYMDYLNEIKREDLLNDLVDRIDNLKKEYMTKDLIKKIDEITIDLGADPVINAQDVTDSMINSLAVNDFSNGDLSVYMDAGRETENELKVTLTTSKNKRLFKDIQIVENK